MSLRLFLTENPKSSIWELPADAGDFSLIGWRVVPEPVDAGVPTQIAGIFARALCDSAVISFLTKNASTVAPTSTIDPQVAETLFEQEYVSWTERAQVVLLSARNVAPPPLTTRELRQLEPNLAKQAGFSGILLPGVDGDVAGLWMFDFSVKQRFFDSLQKQCPFEVVTEDEFRARLSGR